MEKLEIRRAKTDLASNDENLVPQRLTHTKNMDRFRQSPTEIKEGC